LTCIEGISNVAVRIAEYTGGNNTDKLQPTARYLTYLEAVTGQFYIAILVASLIGVRLADRTADQ
jgi:hypothetical protein